MRGNESKEQGQQWYEEETVLRAVLEAHWQEESPATAKVTEVADEVVWEPELRPDYAVAP